MIVLLICHLLFQLSLATAPNVTSSVFQYKKVSIGAITRTYAIAEIDFDQDLAMASNVVCACTNAGTCGTTGTNTVVIPGVTDMTEGVAIEGDIAWGEFPLFRLNVQSTGSVPCPNLNIVVWSLYGSVSLVVAGTFAPDQTNYVWLKSYYNNDRIRICNNDPAFQYGYYHLRLFLSAPFIAFGRFKMYYYLTPSDTCTTEHVPTGTTNTALIDSQYYEQKPQTDVSFFEFQFPTVCANFSVTVRKSTSVIPLGTGEMDLFVSFTSPTPSLANFEYQSAIEGDDTITLMNICNPAGTVNWPAYIGAQFYGADLATAPNFTLMATAKYGFAMTPISNFGLSTSLYLLSAQTFTVTCGSELFAPVFPPFTACYGQNYTCAYPVYPLGSVTEPSPVLPLNYMDADDLGFINNIDWRPTLDYNVSRANRLTIALLVSIASETQGIYTRYIQNDISTCSVTIQYKLGNAGFEMVQVTTPIKLITPANCSLQDTANILASRAALLATQRNSTALLDLKKTQVQLANLHLTQQYTQCDNYVNTFFGSGQSPSVLAVEQCTADYHSTSWYQDPCCNSGVGFDSCCRSTNATIEYDTFDNISLQAASVCGNSQCVVIISGQLQQQQLLERDLKLGCDAKFSPSLIATDSNSLFIDACRVSVLGNDMLGRACTQDSDCINGSICSNARCNHTEAQVIDCFATSIDTTTGQLLFNIWRIPVRYNTSRMVSELNNRIYSPECVGKDAIQFRDHWEYAPVFPFCVDDSGCVATCFSPTCPLPPECSQTLCIRTWVFRTAIPGCESIYECNTDNCTGAFGACTCNDGSSYCIDCENDDCEIYAPISITDSSACLQGYCDLNATLIGDAAACGALGQCFVDLTCANVIINSNPDPAQCTGGVCTSQCTIQNAYISNNQTIQSGLCLSPIQSESELGFYCLNGRSPLTEGCPELNYTDSLSCTGGGAGFRWIDQSTSSGVCASLMACYDNAAGYFNSMSQTECTNCTGRVWKSVFDWMPATHRLGKLVPLTWQQQTFAPITVNTSSIDYLKFYSFVEEATAQTLALAYNNYEICLYGAEATYLTAVACDCQANNGSSAECYAVSNPTLDEFTACAYLDTFISSAGFLTVHIFDNTINPNEYCQNFKLVFYDYRLFLRDTSTRLSSEIFLIAPKNTYTNVKDYGIYEGQMISSGVEVTWQPANPLANPMEICIVIDQTIPVASDYSKIRLGKLGNDKFFHDYTSVYLTTVNGTNGTQTFACGNITDQGIYIVISIYPNFPTIVAGQIVMCCLASIGYFALALRAFYVVSVYVVYRQHMHHSFHKAVLSVIILVDTVIRGVYFILVATAALEGVTAASYVLFEFPTFLLLVMFSTYVYLLAAVAYKPSQVTFLLAVYLGWIVFIAIIVIVFLVLYYALPAATNTLPCVISSDVISTTSQNISLAYHVVIEFFGLVLVCIAIPISLYIHRQILRLKAAGNLPSNKGKSFREKFSRENLAINKKLKLYMTLIVGLIFSVTFLIKGAIFIAFSIERTQTLPIIVFAFLEILSIGVLLYYIRPSYSPFHKADEVKIGDADDESNVTGMGTMF